jgi:CrcB protein
MPPLAARHPEMQTLRRLLRRRSARSDAGRYVIEGPRLVAEALDAQVEVDAVYVPAGVDDGDVGELRARCAAAGIVATEVAAGVIEQVGSTRTPQLALAVAVPRRLLPWALVALVLAYLVVLLPRSRYRRGLVGTGFCGALTTFSTFGYETVRLAEEGRPSLALSNAAASLGAGLMAAALGWWLGAAL